MSNKSYLFKVVAPNIVLLTLLLGLFYNTYSFLHYDLNQMVQIRKNVKALENNISSTLLSLYQSYSSKDMNYLVLSATNSLKTKELIDELSSLGYDTSLMSSLYLELFKQSVEVSSLFLENRHTQALELLKSVNQKQENILNYCNNIINELNNTQDKITNNIVNLMILAGVLSVILIPLNMLFLINLINKLLLQTKEIKQRAVLLDSIADGVYGVDEKGNCVFINKRALDMLGFEENELLNKDQHMLFHHHKPDGSEYKHTDCPIHKTVNDRQPRELEEYFIRKDGTFFPVGLTVAPTTKGDAVVVFRDMSQIKEYEANLEKEVDKKTKELQYLNETLELKVQEELEKNRQKDILLQQQTRLAAIGEMIGNIAHQWRQPLSAITSSVSGLKLKEDFGILEPNDITEVNDSVMSNAQFLSHTIDNFRNFFKKDQPQKNFYVADAIKDTISIVQAAYDNNFIQIKTNLDENIQYFGSDNLLSQVILNILTNAKDAFVQLSSSGNKVVTITLKQQEDIVITIKDNAGGVPDDLKDKIFDPYFTTKHQSQGTGLGLYMSTQIVHTHFNGIITCENIEDEDGYGACFVVIVPLINDINNKDIN